MSSLFAAWKNSFSLSSKVPVGTILVVLGAAGYVGYRYLAETVWEPRAWWKRRQRPPFFQVANDNDDDKQTWTERLIHGTIEPGWEAVQLEFIENFRSRGELGAAVCIYYRGRKVVDLWGGWKHAQGGAPEPWEKDTIVNVFSTSKGVTALAMAMQHSRGKIDYDEKVSTCKCR